MKIKSDKFVAKVFWLCREGDGEKYLQVEKQLERVVSRCDLFFVLVDEHFSIESDRELVCRAFKLMVECHYDQADRPSGEPYIAHTLDVAINLMTNFPFYTANEVAAALLHDSLEDQAEKLSQLYYDQDKYNWQTFSFLEKIAVIRSRVLNRRDAAHLLESFFNSEVVRLVGKATNPFYDKLMKANPTVSKNQLYKEHFSGITEDPKVFKIKLSDFENNALTIHRIKDPAKKAKLIAKYGPVIIEVIIPALKKNKLGMSVAEVERLIKKFRDYFEKYYI